MHQNWGKPTSAPIFGGKTTRKPRPTYSPIYPTARPTYYPPTARPTYYPPTARPPYYQKTTARPPYYARTTEGSGGFGNDDDFGFGDDEDDGFFGKR